MPEVEQKPDTALGNYYVTVVDAGRVGRLAGPFVNDHAGALSMVDKAKAAANKANDRAWFYAYGTARFDPSVNSPGVLNDFLGL